jgi:hypothetical protein
MGSVADFALGWGGGFEEEEGDEKDGVGVGIV